MHALGGAKGAAVEDPPRKPVPKVAFGSNRDLDKYSHGGPSKLAQQGASVMGAAGSNRGGDTVSSVMLAVLFFTHVFDLIKWIL